METNAFHAVATDGDVILSVGQGDERKSILASATALCQAGKDGPGYFDALLGPKFREGQALRRIDPEEIPVTITLEEDDPQAMIDMCELLHRQEPAGMNKASPERLLGLAIVIDKYSYAETLEAQSYSYLHESLVRHDDTNLHAMNNLAAAAYLLRLQRCFETATSNLIKHCQTSFWFLRGTEAGRILGDTFIKMLEETREVVYKAIDDDAVDAASPRCAKHKIRNRDRPFVPWLAANFKLQRWPPNFQKPDYGIANIIERLKSLKFYARSSQTCHCTGRKVRAGPEEFKAFANELETKCESMCLWCLRGNGDWKDGKCEHNTYKRDDSGEQKAR